MVRDTELTRSSVKVRVSGRKRGKSLAKLGRILMSWFSAQLWSLLLRLLYSVLENDVQEFLSVNRGWHAIVRLFKHVSICAADAFLKRHRLRKHVNRELTFYKIVRGSIVVESLCYKQEGRRFEIRWGDWIFSIYLILPAALGHGIYSAFNGNENQKEKNVSGE
jgi:hypothetical protein